MKTLVYALILCAGMVSKADASVHDYPPPQYVVSKVVKAYYKPWDNYLDPGYLTKLRLSCSTPDRIHYDCQFAVYEGKHRSNFHFTGKVHKGSRSTRIDRFLKGRVRLNSSRFINMTPDPAEWISW